MTIDSVHLHLTDYSVQAVNSLTVKPSPYLTSTGELVSDFHLYTDNEGRQVNGKKAHWNTPHFQLTFAPFTKSVEGVSCFVQFSVPKVHYGNNYYSVGEQGSEAVFKEIEKELWEGGVHTDISTCNITRLDTFKNIEPEENFNSYSPLFGLLKMRRGVDRQYPESFLLRNSQQQFCVYDKIAEMKKRQVDISPFPEKTMRFEHRCMNKQKVQNVFGFSSVESLFEGGYLTVKKRQVEEWKDSLFRYEVEEVMSLGSSVIEQELRYFREKYKRNWFDWFLKSNGTRYLAEVAGVEVVRMALQNIEAEKTMVWRAEKTLEQARRESDFVRQAESTNKTLGTLYLELKEKVLN